MLINARGALAIIGASTKKQEEARIKEFGLFSIGFFGAVLGNDLFRIFNLPGNNAPMIINGKDSGYSWDALYETLFGVGLMAVGLIGKVKGATPIGLGITVGANIAERSENGGYIGFI